MVIKVNYDGDVYVWVEKGNSAALTRHVYDGSDTMSSTASSGATLLWWGSPCDPKSLSKLDAPLEVLLELSVRRGLDRA